MRNNKIPLVDFEKVSYLTINEENQDQRLDNFLFKYFDKQIARALVYELLRTGQVRVNKSRAKHNYRVKLNDILRIPPVKRLFRDHQDNHNNHDYHKDSNKDHNPNKKVFLKKLVDWKAKLKKAIIFENQNLLIINKPAGLAVHGGSKINIGLLELIKNLKPEEHFLELVHRLDKDTSGCIMLAKKRSYLKKLHELLKERKITKIYSALVSGNLINKKVIELSLKKFITSSKEHIVRVTDEGHYAKTICIPEKNFKITDLNLSLIQAKPLTGKTHQIRVHLANEGFPIINDVKYGNRGYNTIIQGLGLKRMFLHAKSLEFVCPNTNEVIFAQAEYDESLKNFLLKLESISG